MYSSPQKRDLQHFPFLTKHVEHWLAVDHRTVGHAALRALAVLHQLAHIAFGGVRIVVLGGSFEHTLSRLRGGL